jgi:hypothetical protein
MNSTSTPASNADSIDNVIYVDFAAQRAARDTADRPAPRRVVRRRPPRERICSDTLAERMTMGDGVAADALKDRYGMRLHRAAKAILGDPVEVADVVALVFEEASVGWPPERGEVERWLLRLVRRAARARRRALEGIES